MNGFQLFDAECLFIEIFQFTSWNAATATVHQIEVFVMIVELCYRNCIYAGELLVF